ncbi:hypothetical protein C8J56DRAFT_47288 [Mycena floridula]|nr:hypothetical protein C8J56DRAFT_47288 [Mycena floridula]
MYVLLPLYPPQPGEPRRRSFRISKSLLARRKLTCEKWYMSLVRLPFIAYPCFLPSTTPDLVLLVPWQVKLPPFLQCILILSHRQYSTSLSVISMVPVLFSLVSSALQYVSILDMHWSINDHI